MNPQYHWYSSHKLTVDTIARYLSLELNEFMPALDKKIKQRQLAMVHPGSGNKRKLNLTIYNDEWISQQRTRSKVPVSA